MRDKHSLTSCVSIGSNNNDLDQEESQNKTLFLEFDNPSFISEDNLYGNFVFEVNEITKDILLMEHLSPILKDQLEKITLKDGVNSPNIV